MSQSDGDIDHDRPCAALGRAEPLLTEMLRQIQEEGDQVSFFNCTIEDTGIGLSANASSLGNYPDLLGLIGGTRVAEEQNWALEGEEVSRLEQRGWTLPQDEDTGFHIPHRSWVGVTSRTDRRHVAREMLSVATEVYGLPTQSKIYVQLCIYGLNRHSDE